MTSYIYDMYGAARPQDAPDTDMLYACPTCKQIYQIVHHHLRPPAEPRCEICRQALPLADEADWLTYQRVNSRR
jgi:hypothetical protein